MCTSFMAFCPVMSSSKTTQTHTRPPSPAGGCPGWPSHCWKPTPPATAHFPRCPRLRGGGAPGFAAVLPRVLSKDPAVPELPGDPKVRELRSKQYSTLVALSQLLHRLLLYRYCVIPCACKVRAACKCALVQCTAVRVPWRTCRRQEDVGGGDGWVHEGGVRPWCRCSRAHATLTAMRTRTSHGSGSSFRPCHTHKSRVTSHAPRATRNKSQVTTHELEVRPERGGWLLLWSRSKSVLLGRNS